MNIYLYQAIFLTLSFCLPYLLKKGLTNLTLAAIFVDSHNEVKVNSKLIENLILFGSFSMLFILSQLIVNIVFNLLQFINSSYICIMYLTITNCILLLFGLVITLLYPVDIYRKYISLLHPSEIKVTNKFNNFYRTFEILRESGKNAVIGLLLMALLQEKNVAIKEIKKTINPYKKQEKDLKKALKVLFNRYTFNIQVIILCIIFDLIFTYTNIFKVGIVNHIFEIKGLNGTEYTDILYYVLVTFSTIGYGDITPLNIESKRMVILLVLSMILLTLGVINFYNGVLNNKLKNLLQNNGIFQLEIICAKNFVKILKNDSLESHINSIEERYGKGNESIIESIRKKIKESKKL